MPPAFVIRSAALHCFAALCLLTASPARVAGFGTATGTVIDGPDGLPLPGVTVSLAKEPDGEKVQTANTDKRGAFVFGGLSAGTYAVTYATQGEDVQKNSVFAVTADRPSVDLGKLILAPTQNLKLEKVEVTAHRQESYNAVDSKVYNVGRDIQSSAGSASDLLQNIPSVQVDIDGNVSLRGNSDVLILIDGKPSALMSAANQADALEQMSASTIDRIEVITSPSAKYKADGTAGIINIVTRRRKNPGYSGLLRVNVGNDGRSNYGLSGNYNPGRYNITANLSVRKDFRPRFNDETRTQLDAASGSLITTKQDIVERMRPLTRLAQFGADYNIDKDDKIGATVDYNLRTFHRTSTTIDATVAADGMETSEYDRLRSDLEWQKTVDFGTTYQHRFSATGDEVDVEAKRERHWEQENNQYTDIYDLPSAPASYDSTLIRPTNTSTDLSVDYSRKMGEAKLDAGYSGEIEKDDMNFLGQYLDPVSGSWLVDPTETNRFIYRGSIQAVYATYGGPVGKFTLLAGLRLEETYTDANQVTTQVRYKGDYLRLYPSLHSAYDLSATGQLVLNYSHRVHRPDSEDLNPFPEYQDPLNLRAGNPLLKPEETHSLEAGYQYRKDDTNFLVAAYFRDTYNAFTTVSRYIDSVTLLTTEENLASSLSEGTEVIYSTPLGRSLTLNLSADAYESQVDATNLGYPGNRSALGWDAKLSTEWRTSKVDAVQFNLNYSGRRLTAQGFRLPNYVANLGYRHQFKGKNLAFVLTISDLLDSLKERTVIDTPVLQDFLTRHRSSRIVYAGITYNFGRPAKAKKDDALQYDNQL